MANRDQCYACSCKFSEGCKAERKAKERVKPAPQVCTIRRPGFYGNKREIKRLVTARLTSGEEAGS